MVCTDTWCMNIVAVFLCRILYRYHKLVALQQQDAIIERIEFGDEPKSQDNKSAEEKKQQKSRHSNKED